MLQIGQIRKSNTTNYLTSLPVKKAYVYNKGDTNNVVFRDFALDLETTGFEANKSYYLRFSVQRYPEDDDNQYGNYDTVNFTLVLCNETGNPETGEHNNDRLQTVEKSLTITPYRKKKETGQDLNSPWQQFTIVFTPIEPARYLWFKINRIGYDYIYPAVDDPNWMGRAVFQYYNVPLDPRNTIEFSNGTRSITIEAEVNAKDRYNERIENGLNALVESEELTEVQKTKVKKVIDNSFTDIGLYWQGEKDIDHRNIKVVGEFSQINNILPRTANQIGIQSRPGSLFVVNHEPIYLGRSGVYEVNNGTNISTIGVVAPNGSKVANIQDFIIDYAYLAKEG